MRRSIVVPIVLLFSAAAVAVGSGDIAQALSEEESADTVPAGELSAFPPAKVEKRLHTVPEDGDATSAFEFVPKWLRDLLASRPLEDLVVCIAGCSQNRDRVVYARLKETPEPKPVAAGEGAPKKIEAPSDAPAAAPEAPVSSAEPPADDAGKAAGDGAAAEQPAFVPTFSRPLATDGAEEPANAGGEDAPAK